MSAVSVRSLIATGTPCKAFSFARFFTARSASRAQASAFSAATVQKALTAGLILWIAARCASTTSTGLAFFVRTSRASSTAESRVSSLDMRTDSRKRDTYGCRTSYTFPRRQTPQAAGTASRGQSSHEPAQSIRTAQATALSPVFPDAVPRGLQRQRLQERSRHSRRLSCGNPEQARRKYSFESGSGALYSAIFSLFRDRRTDRRQAGEIASDPLGEARGDRDHGARCNGTVLAQPLPADDCPLPDGLAFDGIRAGEIRVPAPAPRAGGNRRRERPGGDGHVPRHSRRNAARRISHRRGIGHTGSRDRGGARRTRLSDEPVDTAFARRRARAHDQLESFLRDLADPAVHARQPDGLSLGARDFLVLVSRRAVPVAVPRLHEGGPVRQGRDRDRDARPVLRRSRHRFAPVRARFGPQDRARIGALRLDRADAVRHRSLFR